MNNDTILEKLNEADGLLTEHQFDVALALATSLEEALAALDADTSSHSRVPSRIRDRVQSVRWAAEIGRQLGYLVLTGTNRQLGSAWKHLGASARREDNLALTNIRIQ
jgi:hypothetical protein